MTDKKARALGINHIVLEVGDLDEALEFYGKLFDFSLRGRNEHNAFIDLGDQFIQLRLGKTQEADGARHFGFVVDDPEAAGAEIVAAGGNWLMGEAKDSGAFYEIKYRDPDGQLFDINENGWKTGED